MLGSMIPYNESEEVNFTPPIKCERKTFVATRDGKTHGFLRFTCLCGRPCNLADTIAGGKCSCGREWNADHIAGSALLLVSAGGFERSR